MGGVKLWHLAPATHLTYDGEVTNVDLHFHSNASDGEADIAALVAAVSARPDLEMVALADHDTVDASVAFVAAVPRAIVAVELTVAHRNPTRGHTAPHLLGYGIDPNATGLRAYLAARVAERRARIEAWTAVFRDLGLRFEPDLDTATDAFGKPHIVAELRRHRENTQILPPVADDPSASDPIYERYLKRGGVADITDRVPSSLIGVADGIDLIHAAGGAAVLAHPKVSFYDAGQNRLKADWRLHAEHVRGEIRGWVRDHGLDGLEVFNHGQDAAFRAELIGLADELGLFVTAGSDDHTATGEHIGDAFLEGDVQIREPRMRDWLDAFCVSLRDRYADRTV